MMSSRFTHVLAAAVTTAMLMTTAATTSHSQPRVIASIAPVHSLVAGVMEGIASPDLLVRGANSPHDYSLRPSDAQRLRDARIVFWVGDSYETFLVKPLAALAGRSKVVRLDIETGMNLLTQRAGGPWEEDNHGHAHGPKAKGSAAIDGHIFLDPRNAKVILATAVRTLSEADPANAARYAANGATMTARVDALDAELKAMLAPVARRPFIVFHDAYQYLEQHYGLLAAGSIAASPERRPSAQRLRQLRQKINSLAAVCVFSEPQFDAKLVTVIVEDTRAKTGVLDPLGTSKTPGPNAYFELMQGLGQSLVGCLAPPQAAG
jgi:zinc transport system substrate-binding protein